MRKVTEIPPTQDHRPVELQHLCVAGYCRVSIGRQQYRIARVALFTADFGKSQLGEC